MIKIRKYAMIFGILRFCKKSRSAEKIEAINIERKSITTISLAILNPAIIIIDEVK